MDKKGFYKKLNQPCRFKIAMIGDGIAHVRFKNEQDMCLTLIKPYLWITERPFYKTSFNTKDIIDHQMAKKAGKTYLEKGWVGFGLPTAAIDALRAGELGSLTQKEKKLMDRLKHKQVKYLVATCASDPEESRTLKHELSHALYATDFSYRLKVSKILKKIQLRPFYGVLKKMGYTSQYFKDETHAYLMWDSKTLEAAGMKGVASKFKSIRGQLKTIYIAHVNKVKNE